MTAKGLITAFLLSAACLDPGSSIAEPRSHPSFDTPSRPKSASASSRRARRPPPNSSAATWQMPWEIRPIAYGSRARRERIVEAFVPKTGRVRGTRAAIGTIGQSLRSARGRNRTVNACRAVVVSEAVKFGAKEVEAASAGRERRTASRNYVAPVKFRITYKIGRKYDVRFTVLRCVVSRKGKLLDAYIPKPKLKRLRHRKRSRTTHRRA